MNPRKHSRLRNIQLHRKMHRWLCRRFKKVSEEALWDAMLNGMRVQVNTSGQVTSISASDFWKSAAASKTAKR